MGKAEIKYSPADVDNALLQFVANGANSRAAERETGIEESLIRYWVEHTYSERYREISRLYRERVEDEIIALTVNNARTAAEGLDQVLQKAIAEGVEGKARDTGSLALALSKIVGNQMDKVLTMTGRPQKIVESKDIQNVIKFLADKGVVKVIDGDAEEITDAQLEPG
jgi:predicted transcriptional regulator YheO